MDPFYFVFFKKLGEEKEESEIKSRAVLLIGKINSSNYKNITSSERERIFEAHSVP